MSTDVWAWVHDTHRELVEGGHHRLADAVAEISGHAVNGRPEEVDAIYPEAVAAARSLGLPWVEVYLRHWRLQSLLNERQQGAKALPEATSLLEFAHREETKSCPQSVCVVQDFCIAHARIDGPAYVDERIAILDQTLAGVEPERNCFDCLAREYSDALADAGRDSEALAYITDAEAKHRAAGGDPSLYMHLERARLLAKLNREREALDLLERSEAARRSGPYGLDEDDERGLALQRADLYARLGDAVQAAAHLCDIEEPARHPDLREQWTGVVERLVGLGAYANDYGLGGAITAWAAYLDEVGTHRGCLDMALTGGRLAVARGARTVALALADTAGRKLGDLRRPDPVAAKAVADLRANAEALPVPALPVPAADLPAHLDEERPDSPEQALDMLAEAYRIEPARPVALLYSRYLAGLGHAAQAARLLWDRVEADPADTEQAAVLSDVLMRERDAEGIDRLTALITPVDPGHSLWIRANWAASQGEWAEVARACEAITALDDTVVNTRRLWATAARNLDDYATAQRVWADVLAHGTDDENAEPHLRVQSADRWALIIAATVNGDWAAVREQCAAIGIDLDSTEGPIDEAWHLFDLRYDGPEGRTAVLAVRTGPATARVETVTQPGSPLNHGDVLVIDPAALEPPPEDEDERAGWIPSYAAVKLIAPGGFTSYPIDGVHPGEEALEAFVEAVRGRGYGVWIYTDDGYQVTLPDTGEETTGVYVGVAVPPTVAAAEACDVFAELTADWPHPMAWLALAEAAGRDVERHRKITEQYGL